MIPLPGGARGRTGAPKGARTTLVLRDYQAAMLNHLDLSEDTSRGRHGDAMDDETLAEIGAHLHAIADLLSRGASDRLRNQHRDRPPLGRSHARQDPRPPKVEVSEMDRQRARATLQRMGLRGRDE